MTPTLPHEGLLRRIGAVADGLGLETYAVGGAVRDALLGRPASDLDVVTVGSGSGIALAQAVAAELGGRAAHVYDSFGTAAVHARDAGGAPVVVEFVGARRESYRRDSRKPIVEDGTLEDDLRRRDFTVNALAAALNSLPRFGGAARFGELVDPSAGLADLASARLRTPLDPHVTFDDDPLRMMRAARFATQLGFSVVPEAVAALRVMAGRIAIVSQERATDELQKIAAAPVPSVGLRLLYETGVLDVVFPELVRLAGVEAVGSLAHKDNFYHTLQVLDNLAALQREAGLAGERATGDALWLRWAALLHDIAKPDTKRFVAGLGWTFHGHEDRGARRVERIFRRLKLPLGDGARLVEKMVRLHHRPTALVDEEVTDSAVRRLLFDAGEDTERLMMLVRADVTSKNARRVRRYLAGFDRVEAKMREVEEKDRVRTFEPPVSGHEIMTTLGLAPGPAVGRIKDAIEEAILDGTIANEHDAAFGYMMAVKDGILAALPERRPRRPQAPGERGEPSAEENLER